jgi:hypothetical protein
MKTLRLCIAFAVLFAALSTAGQQQTGDAKQLPLDITLDTLLVKYQTAMGGAEASSKLGSAVSKGEIEISGLEEKGSFEAYEKAPNLMLLRMNFPGGMKSQQGCDGKIAWEQDEDGVKEYQGVELAEELRDCDFLSDFDLKRTYKELKLTAKMQQGGREYYFVDASRHSGKNEVLLFDVKEYLLAVVIRKHDVDGTETDVPFATGDYRIVDGVKVPFQARTKIGQLTLTLRTHSVQFNVDLDDGLFAKPKQ